MNGIETEHIMGELREARAEVDRLLALIRDNTRYTIRGENYWPDWAIGEIFHIINKDDVKFDT